MKKGESLQDFPQISTETIAAMKKVVLKRAISMPKHIEKVVK